MASGRISYLRLLEHASKVLDVEPIPYQRTKITVQHDSVIDETPLTPEALDTAISSAGYARLRIVHLSAWPSTRERVRLGLGSYQSKDPVPLLPDVGVVQVLTGRSEVVAYDVPSLLEHGKSDRSVLLTQAPLLKPEAGTLVLALVDTEYEVGKVQKDDAKLPLRLALAKMGVPSQFISIAPGADGSRAAPRKKPSRKKPVKDVDYPIVGALRELMRTGGLTDGRFSKAVALKPFPLDRGAWWWAFTCESRTRSRGTTARTAALCW